MPTQNLKHLLKAPGGVCVWEVLPWKCFCTWRSESQVKGRNGDGQEEGGFLSSRNSKVWNYITHCVKYTRVDLAKCYSGSVCASSCLE